MHNNYKVGNYWKNILNFERRVLCAYCGNVTETMEHILTECSMSGQNIV